MLLRLTHPPAVAQVAAAGLALAGFVGAAAYGEGGAVGWLPWAAAGGVAALTGLLCTHLRALGHRHAAAERRAAERTADLRTTGDRFRALVEHAFDGVTCYDADGRVVYVSPNHTRLSGRLPADVLGTGGFDTLHPDDRDAARLVLEEALAHPGRGFPVRVRFLHKNGSAHWGDGVLRNLLADPAVGAVVLNWRDVTEQVAAEAALRASEERFRDFFDLSEDLFAITGFDGYFRRVSPAFVRTLGYPEEEFGRRPVIEFVHPADRAATLAECHRLAAGGGPRVFENRYVRADGGHRWLQWRVALRPDDQLTYAVGRDVTGARAAAELMEQTHRAARVGGWELDLATNHLTWTAETYRIHDTSPDEHTPTLETVIRFFAPESRPAVEALVRRLPEMREGWNLELELVTARGRRVWTNVVGRVVREDDRPVKALGSIQDVTDRKRAELALQTANEELEARVRERTAALEAANARLREAQSIAGIGSYVWDAAADALTWSDELDRVFGTLPATAPATLAGYLGRVHPDQREGVRAAVARALDTGRDCSHEYRIVRPDGQVRWVHARGKVVRGPGGGVRLEGTCQDVTDQKAADEALRRSEALTRAIIDAEPECVKVLAPDCRLVSMNPAGLRMVETEAADAVAGADVSTLVLPEYREGYRAAVAGAFAGRQTVFEFEFAGLRGTRRRMEQYAAPIPDPDHPGRVTQVIAVSRDVTERAATEAALRRSEALNRAVLDSLTAHIVVLARDGTILAVNDAWTRFARGHPGSGCMTDGASAVGDNYLAACAPGAGEPGAARAGVRAVLDGTAPGHGGPYPCGGRWFMLNVTPLAGPGGGAVVSHADITDLKRAEEAVRASLQEKEALLKEVHHRVKNNLQIVMSLLNLQADSVTDPAVLGALRESRDRVRSMALIHETLYRSESLARLDLADYVESLCDQIVRSYATAPERVRLDLRVEPVALDLDRAIPAGLLLNELVSNALKHAFPGGRAGVITVTLAAGPDGTVGLTVADDGVGFPPGLDTRRTDTLGLQLVAALTRQIDGTLDLTGDSGVQAGVTFRA